MSTKLSYTKSQPLPVVDIQKASEVNSVTETVSFLLTTGVASAGEAAGTIVVGQVNKAPITSLTGDRIGEFSGESMDSSVSFTDGVMVKAQEKIFRLTGGMDDRIAATAETLTVQGDWALDYETGLLVINKKTTADSVAITYKIRLASSGASSGGATETKQDTLITALPDSATGTWVTNNSFTEALIVAGARRVRRIHVLNTAVASRYLQFHDDADGVIADATTPLRQILVEPGQAILGTTELGQQFLAAANGISITQSTIYGAYADATQGTAGDLKVSIEHTA